VTVNTGSGDGTIGLNLVDDDSIVAGGFVLGGVGVATGNSTGEVFTIDKTAPTVTINQAGGQADPAAASPINFAVVFSEAVTGFTGSDVALSGTAGASTAVVTGSGATYNVAVSGMLGNGTVTATIPANRAADATGNANLASTSTDNTVTFAAHPVVTSIERYFPLNATTNAASVQYYVYFSQAVTGVDASDFVLTTGLLTGASITGVSGSGALWVVDVNTGTGSGVLRLDLVDDDSIAAGGFKLGGVGAGNGNFTGQPYAIDKTVPTVVIGQASGQADPTAASPINFTAVFGKAVTGFTGSDVTLSGTAGATTAVVTGSGTTYNVAVSGMTANGTVIATIPAGAATDGAGNTSAASTSGDNTVTYTGLNPPRLFNISTRMQVLTGNDRMIAGFIVGGSTPKTVVINVAGPSLVPFGIPNALMNPTLTLVRSSDQTVVKTNDDWQTQAIPGDLAALQASGFKPNDTAEPAVIATLDPGAYTAIVEGVNATTGVGLVGVFEVDHAEIPLVNISTRGQVLLGNDRMIAGFIIQGDNSKSVVINVAGPSLVPFGIANALMNPKLTVVRSSDQSIIATNDDWQAQANPADVAAIIATGFQPNNSAEPALLLTLPPGAYTAIVEGATGGTGVGLVGVFAVP
jgi:hypothetical protein